MPPSPAMRCSPKMEIRAEHHKRGHSLESGILFKEKDDDLALFNEVQKRESDNFLLQSNDDFEYAFSTKLRQFSGCKLGISIPARGESSDLLIADGEKNDYDWLLTPPDTPLFPSLDDEEPPVSFPQRGRPRSQPISISRSSTMEKRYSSRGSASPNCSSLSPRSGNSAFQARGRASSAPLSSPTPTLHHATSSRRASPPPSKPSTPVRRSSTPTPRRVSTGSSGNVSSSRVRGTSPVKTIRGNSMSPKIQGWQSNFSGFSSEAPPNLCTSLADRPASYVRGSSTVSRNGRGSSPTSRNGKDSSSRSGRQSMSPTASRSVSSSHNHDRERFSSYSKGSVASSDDADSLQSVALAGSGHLFSRSVGTVTSNRTLASSRKPTRILPSSSAPKRSFDLAMRQMDHRKGPQMFRPLLSSVPSSSFYVGKASAAHRPLISRNSSVTTSSNASSDQGTSVAHDTEGSDQNHEDMTSGFVRAPDPDLQDEIFSFDKADASKENVLEIHEGSPSSPHGECNGEAIVESQLGDSENFSRHGYAMGITAAFEHLDMKADVSNVDDHKDTVLCVKCGCKFHAAESIERDLKLCPDCSRSTGASSMPTLLSPVVVAENSPRGVSARVSEEHESNDAMECLMVIPESPDTATMGTISMGQHEEFVRESENPNGQPSQNSLSEDSITQQLVDRGERRLVNEQVIGQTTVSCSISDGVGPLKMQHVSDPLLTKACVSEWAGISVLLKRSCSVKGPVLQSRTFTATIVPHDDLSYVRDSANPLRSSLGHSSGSASSSVDMFSARQTETRVQRQLSDRKSDIESYRHDLHTEYYHAAPFVPATSSHILQPVGLPTCTQDQSIELSGAHLEKEFMDRTSVGLREEFLASENTEVIEMCTGVESNDNYRTRVASTSELSSQNIHQRESSVTSSSNLQEFVSQGNGEILMNSSKIFDIKVSVMTVESESSHGDEERIPYSLVDGTGTTEVPTSGSLDKISKMEIVNGHLDSPGSQSDVPSPNSRTSIGELQGPSLPTTSDMDTIALIAECDLSDHAHDIPDESTVVIGDRGGAKARSLTLEEATDTILFCSSIVQSLAYEAATIAMEKEILVPLEGSLPTVNILGKSNSDKKNPHIRMPQKRNFKTPKAKQRPLETDAKPPPDNNEVDENADIPMSRIVGTPNKVVDSTKPPKLESKCNCTIM